MNSSFMPCCPFWAEKRKGEEDRHEAKDGGFFFSLSNIINRKTLNFIKF